MSITQHTYSRSANCHEPMSGQLASFLHIWQCCQIFTDCFLLSKQCMVHHNRTWAVQRLACVVDRINSSTNHLQCRQRSEGEFQHACNYTNQREGCHGQALNRKAKKIGSRVDMRWEETAHLCIIQCLCVRYAKVPSHRTNPPVDVKFNKVEH